MCPKVNQCSFKCEYSHNFSQLDRWRRYMLNRGIVEWDVLTGHYRREIYSLLSLTFSQCANILWLLRLHWCRLSWTGQIDWSSLVVSSYGCSGSREPGTWNADVRRAHAYMDIVCTHVCACMRPHACVRVCHVSRWSEGLCYLNWLIHHATSPLLRRSAIWTTHLLLLFCVLYLHKLVTGLKSGHHKWCEENLERCLSASICSFHFLHHNPAVSERLVGGKTQGKKVSISCLSAVSLL